MEIDDKLVKKLKDEHYEAVSIRHELEADVRDANRKAAHYERELSECENTLASLKAIQEKHEELLGDMKEIYELLSGKKYAELFKKLSDVIYQTIGRVV